MELRKGSNDGDITLNMLIEARQKTSNNKCSRCEELEKKIKKLEKSNRNWRRKVQRLRNAKEN